MNNEPYVQPDIPSGIRGLFDLAGALGGAAGRYAEYMEMPVEERLAQKKAQKQVVPAPSYTAIIPSDVEERALTYTPTAGQIVQNPGLLMQQYFELQSLRSRIPSRIQRDKDGKAAINKDTGLPIYEAENDEDKMLLSHVDAMLSRNEALQSQYSSLFANQAAGGGGSTALQQERMRIQARMAELSGQMSGYQSTLAGKYTGLMTSAPEIGGVPTIPLQQILQMAMTRQTPMSPLEQQLAGGYSTMPQGVQ